MALSVSNSFAAVKGDACKERVSELAKNVNAIANAKWDQDRNASGTSNSSTRDQTLFVENSFIEQMSLASGLLATGDISSFYGVSYDKQCLAECSISGRYKEQFCKRAIRDYSSFGHVYQRCPKTNQQYYCDYLTESESEPKKLCESKVLNRSKVAKSFWNGKTGKSNSSLLIMNDILINKKNLRFNTSAFNKTAIALLKDCEKEQTASKGALDIENQLSIIKGGGNYKDLKIDLNQCPQTQIKYLCGSPKPSDDKPSPKTALNHDSCRYIPDMPSFKIDGEGSCGKTGNVKLCVRYVACKSPVSSDNKEMIRMATCSLKNCGEEKAAECSAELGYGSKDIVSGNYLNPKTLKRGVIEE